LFLHDKNVSLLTKKTIFQGGSDPEKKRKNIFKKVLKLKIKLKIKKKK
jgi:hypothetical protein